MTFIDFRKIILTLNDCETLEQFISERGYQEWMNEYIPEDSDSSSRVVDILTATWGLKENPIKGIKKVTGYTSETLGCSYGVSIRSIDNWSCGLRKCPDYTWMMLAYCVFSDSGII
jgi:hypothetical protein